MFGVCTILTPVSVLRAITTGWLTLYTVHLVTWCVMFALHLFRNRIPRAFTSAFGLTYMESMGVLGLLTMGTLGYGCMWLLMTSFLVGALYGYRAGLRVAMANLVVVVVAAVLYKAAVLTVPVTVDAYMKSTAAWALTLSMMVMIPYLLLNTLVLHKQAISRLVEQVEAQRREIEHLAVHDPKTGLVTTRIAQDRLKLVLKHASRNGRKAAVLFIDLDGFKQVNDNYGHAAGDTVLRAVGDLLQSAVRDGDTVARIGGDEFLVILDELRSIDVVDKIASRILQDIRRPITHGRHQLRIGASIGIAVSPDHGTDPGVLQAAADAAMYGVKVSGKNNYAYASTGQVETGAWTRMKRTDTTTTPAP